MLMTLVAVPTFAQDFNAGETLSKFVREMGFLQFFSGMGWGNAVMIVIACVLLYLGIKKKFEPLLLVGIAFGALLTNLPGANLYHMALWDSYVQECPYDSANDFALYDEDAGAEISIEDYLANYQKYVGENAVEPNVIEHLSFTDIIHVGGLLDILYLGVKLGIYPCLIFMGVGAMTDFGPLIANPKAALLGGAAQFGIFFALFGALGLAAIFGQDFFGCEPIKAAASIGIIGGADGPTAIWLTSRLAPNLLGAIAVAAYSYMALVPIIQPPIMNALTTKEERLIRMPQLRPVKKIEKICFPLIVLLLCALLLPSAVPLIGALMLGNLAKEAGPSVARISDTMSNALINIVTIMLGLSVGSKLACEKFLSGTTLAILALGLCAFCVGTAAGVLMAKLMNVFSSKDNKINPLIGSAGVSAVPMAARVSNKVSLANDPTNFVLMQAMGPNVSGVIGSAVVAGILYTLCR